MAEVRPFCGIRFDGSKVSDIGTVLCPPYDVISAQDRKAYHEKSAYNVIRLEDGFELPGDCAGNNKYTRAGETWRRWLGDGILQSPIESGPAFYIHRHRFTYGGKVWQRRGLIGCVRLEPWDRKVVLPHENTGENPKLDRLKLMRACQANISPILALYQDRGGSIGAVLDRVMRTVPSVHTRLDNGEEHSLWEIVDEELTNAVERKFARKRIYIADGHHRYETALLYEKEMGGPESVEVAAEGASYVMMTLVELSDPGLLILPVHRLVNGLSREKLEKLKAKVGSLFKVDDLSVISALVPDRASFLVEALQRGQKSRMAIGLLGLEGRKSFHVLRPRAGVDYERLMPPGHSPQYYRLGVSRLEHTVLDELVAADRDVAVAFTHDASEVLAMVSSGEYLVGFLVNALKPNDVKMIASAGDKAPRKSTYFYPKLPTGLVMRSLVNGL